MAVIFSIPILLVLLVLQSTVASKVTLLNGTADLLLVWLAAWALSSKDRSGFILAGIAGACFVYNRNTLVYLFIGVPFSNFTRALLFSKTLGITFVGDVDNHYDRKHLSLHIHIYWFAY